MIWKRTLHLSTNQGRQVERTNKQIFTNMETDGKSVGSHVMIYSDVHL